MGFRYRKPTSLNCKNPCRIAKPKGNLEDYIVVDDRLAEIIQESSFYYYRNGVKASMSFLKLIISLNFKYGV
jgi:hypothetical protein